MRTEPLRDWSPDPLPDTRLGFDLARVSAVTESIQRFGRRYTDRVFTSGELDHALSGHGVCAERLAARFAAKEAVMKALGLSETGIGWRDIEVVKRPDGSCGVQLHGRAAQAARELRVARMEVSLSHDGDYAGAVVQVVLQQ
jgi:holo-[acyl-carrier protein] synthase